MEYQVTPDQGEGTWGHSRKLPHRDPKLRTSIWILQDVGESCTLNQPSSSRTKTYHPMFLKIN